MRTFCPLAACVATLIVALATPQAKANITWGSTTGLVPVVVTSSTLTVSGAVASLSNGQSGFFALTGQNKFVFIRKESGGDAWVHECRNASLRSAALGTSETVSVTLEANGTASLISWSGGSGYNINSEDPAYYPDI